LRYRRLSYRYTMVMDTEGVRSWADIWRTERPSAALARPYWRPPTDVYETTSKIMVMVEVGGVEEDEMEVLLFENALVVEGRRQLQPAEAGGVYHSAEIRQGQFRIAVALPARVDYERVEATYDQGLLQVTLGKGKERVGQ